jgi:hypothetical protein
MTSAMIVDLALEPAKTQEQAVAQGFAHALLESDNLLGWIGGLPEYNDGVRQLHPLVVRHTPRESV